MAAINATNRRKYTEEQAVATMPLAITSNGTIHFFRTGHYILAENVRDEYDELGLNPVDPHTLCAFNAVNHRFANRHPNGTPWQDAQGHFYYVDFARVNDESWVRVAQQNRDWNRLWWLAGINK